MFVGDYYHENSKIKKEYHIHWRRGAIVTYLSMEYIEAVLHLHTEEEQDPMAEVRRAACSTLHSPLSILDQSDV